MSNQRIGVLSGAYINTGSYASPSWAEIKCLGDCAVNANYEEGDASTRATRVMYTETTRFVIEVTGRVKVEPDNEQYEAILAAFTEDQPLEFLFLNGKIDKPDSTGYRFHGKVFNLSEDQALGAVLYRDFVIKPCPPVTESEVPQAARVANDGDSVTYSDIGEDSGS